MKPDSSRAHARAEIRGQKGLEYKNTQTNKIIVARFSHSSILRRATPAPYSGRGGTRPPLPAVAHQHGPRHHAFIIPVVKAVAVMST
jgi:hypothetical protein